MLNIRFNRLFVICSLLVMVIAKDFTVVAQQPVADSTTLDSLLIGNDNSLINKSLSADSLAVDSIAKPKKKNQTLEDQVKYSAEDSIEIDMVNRKLYLYGKAKVNYGGIELTANYIEFDMGNEKVYATGLPDSTGTETGTPVFTQGSEKFESKTITYNFKTKKGYIVDLRTKQDDGYLHSSQTKRNSDGHIHMRNGKYTTCDEVHPHFYLALTKAVAIPEDKIISGPAYMVMGDIPLPIGLPFGFFPNSKKNQSGILIPTFGEEIRRGFFFRNGGVYLAISDQVDMKILGDIYTRGSWGLNLASNYRVRYRYSGAFTGRYYKNVFGDKGSADYQESTDFSVQWSHSQDAKANPYTTFQARVDYSTSGFDRNQSWNSTRNYLQNTKSSSVTYSKRWADLPFNMTGGLTHTQNSIDSSVNLTLPNISFNASTLYPFRKKERAGKMKWYENIQFSYSSQLMNSIETKDSLFFKRQGWENLNTGFQHNIPLSTNIKLGRNITITPSINYRGVMYTETTEQYWDDSLKRIEKIRHKGLAYGQSIYPALGASWNPKVYGMYTMTNKNSRIKAIRHVMTPQISTSYVPNVSSFNPNYYREIVRPDSTIYRYSIFDNGRFGTPSPGSGQSMSVDFSLRNTLEMKMLPKGDTVTEVRKVKLLDQFDFRTRYDVFADSMNLSTLSFNASSRLFKDKVDIRLTALFDPYALDAQGRKTKEYLFNKRQNWYRLTNASLTVGTSFQSEQGKKDEAKQPPTSIPPITGNPADAELLLQPVDFDIPWSLSLNYNLNYSKPAFKSTFTNTFDFSGDLSITKKWKVGFSSGYDFKARQITYTSFDISRDLHCWEMRLNWIPYGYNKSYYFVINIKSSMLRDLKYDKRKSRYDTF